MEQRASGSRDQGVERARYEGESCLVSELTR